MNLDLQHQMPPLRQAGIAAGALGVGAGLMYFLDPQHGRLRRARTREAVTGAGRSALQFRPVEPDTSDIGIARMLEAAINRTVSHPAAISASVRDGVVTLSGPILTSEVDRLIARVDRIAGVRGVRAQLSAHGHAFAHDRGIPLRQERWSVPSRVLAGVAGGVLLATAWRSRSPGNWILSVLAGALLVRAATSENAVP